MKVEFKSGSPAKMNVKDVPVGATFQVGSCTDRQNLFLKVAPALIIRLDERAFWYGEVVQGIYWPDCVIVNAKVVVE